MKSSKFGFYFLVAILVLFGVIAYKMFLPFFATLITAFIFWQLLDPLYKYLARIIKNNRVASLLTCIIVIIAIILPVFGIGSIAASEAINLYKDSDYRSEDLINLELKIKEFVFTSAERLGIAPKEFDLSSSEVDLGELIKRGLEVSSNLLAQAYTQVSSFVFLVFVMIFVLYYLFIDGKRFVDYVFKLSPLGDNEESIIWNKFLSMTRATIKGNFAIGIIQGILGGISFWALGIGAPFLWGVVMGIFSVLPLIGPVAVWVPAVVWLFIIGAWVKAIILIIIGSLIIGSVDNFLRPKLIGNDTALHPVWIMIGTFGGIIEFGIMGFVIGPIIITIFLALLEIFEKKVYKKNHEA